MATHTQPLNHCADCRHCSDINPYGLATCQLWQQVIKDDDNTCWHFARKEIRGK